MNFPSHFLFGVFTGLFVYYLTNNLVAAFIVFVVQIILILDFLCKRLFHFEPFHTVLAMLVFWLVSFFAFPEFHWFVFLAYFSHLFLDIFVDEDIPLLFPSKKKLMYPIEHSELFVCVTSIVGSVVILFLI